MNAVGERNAGKLLVAFDEGLLGNASDLLYLDVEGSGVIQTFTLRGFTNLLHTPNGIGDTYA